MDGGWREGESPSKKVSECGGGHTDVMEEGRKTCRGREKNEGFNSLPTSVYLEKKPLCHSVILTTYTRASVSPTMTAF